MAKDFNCVSRRYGLETLIKKAVIGIIIIPEFSEEAIRFTSKSPRPLRCWHTSFLRFENGKQNDSDSITRAGASRSKTLIKMTDIIVHCQRSEFGASPASSSTPEVLVSAVTKMTVL